MKAKEKLNWTPEISFEKLAKLMYLDDLDYFTKGGR